MTRLLLASLALTACTPAHVQTWAALLDLPDVDANDPHAQALAADAWCQHGAELAALVGPEAVAAMPPGDLPACPPPGWVDLGHGVYGPPHLIAIGDCESDHYADVSPSGAYRGRYQFDQRTWDGAARTAGRPDLVGVDPAAAAPADQDLLAAQLYSERGAQPWPVCGRR